jgi:hypothetical protein
MGILPILSKAELLYHLQMSVLEDALLQFASAFGFSLTGAPHLRSRIKEQKND